MSENQPPDTGRAALEAELYGYPTSSVTVKACQALLRVLPGAPALPAYSSIRSAGAAMKPPVPPEVVARAEALTAEVGIEQALFAARSIDTGDTGISIVTGVSSALSLFFGKEKAAASFKARQRTDAALKALGLAYMVSRLIPRPPAQRLAVLQSIPAGQEIVLWFAAVELALPLREEVEAGGGTFVAKLVEEHARSVGGKLLGVIGRQGVDDAQETLNHILQMLDDAALFVAPHTTQLADSMRGVLPKAMTGGQTLQDVVATGADALPAYRYLCARLAAESCLALAKLELMPLVDEPVIAGASAAPLPPPPSLPASLLQAASAASGLRPGGFEAAPVAEPEGAPSDNPFAAGPYVPAHAPKEEPAAPSAGNPFAAAAPSGGNPFADPVAPQPSANPFAAPPEPEPPPQVEEPLPPEARISGTFLHADDGRELWLVFTAEGRFTNEPPSTSPVDWSAHEAAGHQVARYRRDGNRLTITWPDGRTTESTVVVDTYAIVLDGIGAMRCDFALTGSALEGTWRERGSDDVLRVDPSGRYATEDEEGTYALGTAVIELTPAGGQARQVPFLSPLKPSARTPASLWLGGRRYDLTGNCVVAQDP